MSAEQEPMAWAVYWTEHHVPVILREPPSNKWNPMPRVVPLYERQQATLTADEREAVAAAIAEVDYEGRPPSLTRMANTLRGLLERTK